MKFAIQPTSKTKLRLDIALYSLVALTFILIIVRVANKGTPSSRCLKPAVFLAYQIVTGHVDRFKRWRSIKVNKILTIIDTVFWFALFIITISGTSSSHSTISRALGAIIIILALILCYVCIRIRKREEDGDTSVDTIALQSAWGK
ncbi:hypothetical protein TSTA_096120 [Talaromyces stipitatus ATCC 10500]|uniref:Uncharacterized protein n=1 Tax=Talaromyces stipitatus (strain ATCC 10500 / CBS 375.48 / QM 6759 / NRRL 1006) TaxID=441959 RepID=B8M3J1_TALSN|nr:uncharacterized protein TSTA_096120 [Talaromyces stipitatus ATCC 10500]EED22363.1 hypothetical protein TSTA_096120 [Talaromyces stipitatus ATCC 10500]